MIKVMNLEKRFGDVTVVSGVSFEAERGDILGFLGPNGAGKTTTMRMLVTFLPPTSGTAEVAGYDILRESAEVRKRLGYLPENPPLYNEMRVTEYLKFMGEIKGVSSEELKSRIPDLVDICALSGVANKLCGHLSKGFRQRVGLAQALIHNPDVIILDEPTSGLDPVQIIEIRKLISSLAESHTVVLSTHILPEVTEVCNKVVILSAGKVALESDLEELLQDRTLEEVFMESIALDTSRHSGSEQVAIQ
ncbi:MAG: ATP-binding cassette domain-containing protein [Deltaproteobacteria bacterium]|nr:ATP-binding cassette domain-containing protein [Deltaproteobacteria bacterium]